MEDLIKREDAIEAIEVTDWYHQNRNKDMVSGANSDEHQAWYKAEDVYKALEAIPSADRPQKAIAQISFDEEKLHEIVKEAVERFKEEYEIVDRPQGEWIIRQPKPFFLCTCSACGETEEFMTKYCPNCGARMKGADDEKGY